jgi:thiosulfate reductase cytochrome b subunit
MTSNKALYLYPVWLRLWHMLNALMFLFLIITGISMQYANVQSNSVLRFDISVKIHNVSGIILTINYLLFILGNISTKNGKYYKLIIKGMTKRLIKQIRYYTFGIFKNEPAPFPVTEEEKFNPLQQLTYIIAMYVFLPFIFITGWAMIFPGVIVNKVFGTSGFFLTDIVHVIFTFLGTVFMVIHIYFCTIGKTAISNFKSMLNGWHESH